MEKKSAEKKPLVLVVEDDSFLAGVHEAKFAKEKVEVVIKANGQEALEFLKTRKPDMILLDLVMPVMDGFETLKRIKSDPETKDIKVIILTNLSLDEDRERVLNMGALDYIIKANVSYRQIMDLIKKNLAEE